MRESGLETRGRTLVEEPPHRRRTKRPSEEDLQLWRQVTRDIKPLKPETLPPKAVSRAALKEEAPPSRQAPRASTAAPAVAPVPTSATARVMARVTDQAKPSIPELSHGDLRAMDKRRAQRLRRGRLP